MCTCTVIQWPTSQPGYRLLFNRDEQRTRPEGAGPACETFGKREAIVPRDLVAGGTWIGVNDAGLGMALLNVYPIDARSMPKPRSTSRRSRGWIIRSLLDREDSLEAIQGAAELEHEAYPPFALIAVDDQQIATLRWDGESTTRQTVDLSAGPFLRVSSGLGDAKVLPPRRKLFEEMVVQASPSQRPLQQDRFHRHRWPEHPELSVCMSRSDAMTVSLTCVEVAPNQVTMTYFPKPPNEPVEAISVELPRRMRSL